MDLWKNLKVESVWRLHPTQAWEIAPDQTVGHAVALMREKKVGCVLVSHESQIVGIFTERDLLRKVLAASLSLDTPISSIMTPYPVSVDPQDSVASAIRRMIDGGYRHLPVVQDGKAKGILSVKRIIHYLAEHYPEIHTSADEACPLLPPPDGE